MEILSKIDSASLKMYLFIETLIESLLLKVKNETVRRYCGPLTVFVVVVFVLFITWALGDTLCWRRGKKTFQWSVKLGKAWEFKLGCR